MKIGSYEIDNIYNVDCYEAIKNIPDKSIDCIYVDVPYKFVDNGAGNTDIAIRATKRQMELMGIDSKTYDYSKKPAENLRIARNKINNNNNELIRSNLINGFDYKTFLDESKRVLKKINMFIWCSSMQIREIMQYIYIYICKSTPQILVWCKTNPIPTTNNNWLSDIEYCIHIRESGVKLSSKYEYSSKFYISSANVNDKNLYDHPTIKPLEFVKNHILNATKENDIVLDCFLGSGTTAVACKELNRHYLGFEISEEYYKIAKDRLNGITQEDRKKEKIGQIKLF